MAQNLHEIRSQFPSLGRVLKDRPVIYFDGPAGTQVPSRVANSIAECMLHHNANRSGRFATSREVDALMATSHRIAADFLGAASPEAVSFGPNMTTLTFAFSRALSRTWKPGDEVLVSRLDHDANFTPWIRAAEDVGAVVKYIDIHPEDATLDLDSLRSQLSSRSRLVAVTAASNAVGSITPISEIADMVHAVGAELFVDAVHFAPHRRIDVKSWKCDFLVCSAYKFFGPHIGLLYGRPERMLELQPYKLRPAPNTLPGRWMTGTQNHSCIVGVSEAIEYIAHLSGLEVDHSNRAHALDQAFSWIESYETQLIARLIAGLQSLPNVRILGITDPARFTHRAPTVAFQLATMNSEAAAQRLGDDGIFVWHGNYYALPLTERLQAEPEGMVRIGCMHYNTIEEVDRTIEAIRILAQK